MYSCRDWHLLQLMQRGTCYKEEVFLCHSVSEQWGRANSVQLGKTWILQRASVDVWDGVLISLATQTTCEINGVIPGLWDWMCCLFVCVSPCGMVSGKKTVSLVQSSESFMWNCQFLIYSGNRMRNLFWLSSNGFQPRTLLVNHLLFLGKGICLERVYITLLQEIFSLSHITRGYLAARYCG